MIIDEEGNESEEVPVGCDPEKKPPVELINCVPRKIPPEYGSCDLTLGEPGKITVPAAS